MVNICKAPRLQTMTGETGSQFFLKQYGEVLEGDIPETLHRAINKGSLMFTADVFQPMA